jgi:hypothetical protein
MGFKLQGALRCGACGKTRGLGVHLCSPGKRKRRRTTLANPVAWECGRCHEPRGVRHTCRTRSDFKARKRKAAAEDRKRKRREQAAARAARRKQVAADRRARDRARKQAAKGKPRPPRPKGESHEPGSCGDHECQRYGCKAYWAGLASCVGPHEGE